MDINTIVGMAMKYVAATGGYDTPSDAPEPLVIVIEDYSHRAAYFCVANALVVNAEILRTTTTASSDFNTQVVVHEITHWAQCMSGYAFGKRRCDLEVEAYKAQRAWADSRGLNYPRPAVKPRTTSCRFNGNIFLQKFVDDSPKVAQRWTRLQPR